MRMFSVVMLALVAACAGRYVTPSPVRPGAITSSPSDGIRVMESPDAAFGSAKYTGSGRRLAGRVVQALQGQYVDVQMVPTTREPDALQAARAARAKYLVVPTILHWEDRNTAWSMNPDGIPGGSARIQPANVAKPGGWGTRRRRGRRGGSARQLMQGRAAARAPPAPRPAVVRARSASARWTSTASVWRVPAPAGANRAS